jgi:hypothetical protein
MEIEMVELTLEEIDALPKIRASWDHDDTKKDYDIWLTAKQRLAYGLLWLFECPHGRWLLIGAPATVHEPWKKKWHQGVIKLPADHKNCKYKLYSVTFSDLKTMFDVYLKLRLW